MIRIRHLFCSLCIACFLSTHAFDIKIELADVGVIKKADGSTTHAVVPGQTFTINVIISSGERNTGNASLAGVEAFNVLGQSTSTQVQVINGTFYSNKTTSITATAKNEGSFTIGPAKIRHNGKEFESNTIVLCVDKTAQVGSSQANIPNDTQTQASNDASVLCKMSASKQAVVVGEPFILEATVYSRGTIMGIAMETPSFPGFTVKEIKHIQSKQETIDGREYQAETKKFVLIPLSQGEHCIKPLNLVFNVPAQRKSRRRHGLLDDEFFDSFFGRQAEQKRVHSNSITLSVQTVPSHNESVDGVGLFNKYNAQINKNSAEINEPITMTLIIEGKGNLDSIAIPKLQLPAGFKYYESKSHSEEDLNTDYTGGKKTFEFIIQATKEGAWEIPAQSFTYYNIDTKQFKTIKTNPLPLTVKKGNQQQHTLPKPISPQVSIQNDEPTAETREDINFIQEEALSSQSKSPGAIPWWLFIKLLLLPPIALKRHWFIRTWTKLSRRFNSKKYFEHFDKELDIIIKKNDACALYQFFLNFLAEKFNLSLDQVTENNIEQQLQTAGWDATKINDFSDYLGQCAQIHFSSHKPTATQNDLLLKKAKYWLLMFNP
jgi:hypothetical protein